MTPDGIGVVSILWHRNFALLWWAQLVSLTGDYFLLIALPFHVYERTGSALATGVMFLAQMAPRVALGSIAGVFVDRWDRRRTMIVADVLRALLLLGLLAVRTQEHLWLIYVIAAAQSAVGAFFTPARSALLPLVVAPGRLVQANALNGLTSSVASLVAPPLGGFVLASFGLHTVVLADSASFLVSAFLVAAMSHRAADGAAGHVATPAVSGGGVWARAWGEWREGIRTVREERPLGALLALNGLVHAGMGITAALFVVFIFQVYGGGPLEVGWWVSAQGAGAIASGLIAARVARATTPRLLIAAALLVRGAILVLQLSIPVLWVGVALASVSMAAGVAYTVSTQSVCQTAAPDRQRGRVFGLLDTTTAAAMMSGMLFGSALGDAVGAVPLFGITAVVWLVASLVAWLTLGGSPEFGRTTVPSLPSRAPRHPWDLGQSRVLRPRPGFAASAV